MVTRTRWFAAAVVLLLGLGTWALLGNGEGERTLDDDAPTATHTIATQEVETAKVPASNDSDTAPAPTDRTQVATDPAPVLRIRLIGLHPSAPWTAPIRIELNGYVPGRASRQIHQDSQVPVDGVATFSLPEWTRVAKTITQQGNARDPNYLDLRYRHEFDGPLDAEQKVQVLPIGRITGRVQLEDGRGVARAQVAVFENRGGRPIDGLVTSTTTRKDGTFELKVVALASLFVLAVPTKGMHFEAPASLSGDPAFGRVALGSDSTDDDLLGCSLATATTLGAAVELPPFVLRRAVAVTGTVRHDDGSAVQGMIAYERLDALRLEADTFGPIDWFENGAVARATRWSKSLIDGLFSMPSVPGTRTRIAVTSVDGFVTLGFGAQSSRTAAMALVAGTLPSATVMAPDHVDLVLPAPVRLRVLRGSQPIPAAIVEAIGRIPFRQLETTDANGELRMVGLGPSRVRAVHAGLGSAWRDLDPAIDREVTLELEQSLTPVTLSIEGNDLFALARLRLVRSDGHESGMQIGCDPRLGPGRFVIHVEPGSYRVHVGDFGFDHAEDYLLPQQFDLGVGTEPVQRTLTARFGGQLRVDVRDELGHSVGGTCRVFGPEGEVSGLRFWSPHENVPRSGGPGELLGLGPSLASFALPAGTYTLRFDLGARGRHERVVTVVARELHNVVVQLP